MPFKKKETGFGNLSKPENSEIAIEEVATQEHPSAPIEEVQDKVQHPTEQSIPLSQVSDMVAKMVAEQLAKAQPMTVQANSEPVKEQFRKADASVGLPELEYRDRIYTIKGDKKPVTQSIQTRTKAGAPLQWLNPETGVRHSLFLATNQTTFLEDMQTGDAKNRMLQRIIFRDGMLRIGKDQRLEQLFMACHPGFNSIFIEVDKKAEASKGIAEFELRAKATQIVTSLDGASIDAIGRLVLPHYTEELDSFEVKKEVYNWASANPKKFIQLSEDDTLKVKAVVKTSITRGIISMKNRRLYSADGEVIHEIPFNDDEWDSIASFMTNSKKGQDMYSYLLNSVT